jgi:sec-independent protein translocase protein TatA
MPSLGPAEILVILVVALLVFGPNKMPEIGRQVARGVREFRRVQQHLTSELHSVVSDLDPTAPGPASSGGDPVPSLPPRDITDTSAADAPAAAAPPPAAPATEAPATEASTVPPDPMPAGDVDSIPSNGASGSHREPAPPPPAETA